MANTADPSQSRSRQRGSNMLRFIAGRLVQGVLSILVIATLVFLIVRLTGDPASVMVPDWAPVELQDVMRQRLGLDQPLYLQYLRYIGGILTLDVEKAAAGGRMLARHDGRVVLVAGAIPGERVAARVERDARGVRYAEVVEVLAPSPDRRSVTVEARRSS